MFAAGGCWQRRGCGRGTPGRNGPTGSSSSQQPHVVAVQQGDAAALDLQRARRIVEGVCRIDDCLAEPVRVVGVAGHEVRPPATEQGNDLDADVAAMQDHRHVQAVQHGKRAEGRGNVAVGVADNANFHGFCGKGAGKGSPPRWGQTGIRD